MVTRRMRAVKDTVSAAGRLAQNEELGCAGREARSGRGLGQRTTEMSVAPPRGEDRIMIYGPKSVLTVGDRFDHDQGWGSK
jgi:hypothetical protein